MHSRIFTVAGVLLSAVALFLLLRLRESPESSRTVAVDAPAETSPRPETISEPRSSPAPVGRQPVVQTPVDVATRERFNEQAREFFANASQMTVEDRVREAQQLEQELARLEQAGGLSAGETLLIRAGLIRETVPAGAQQDAQLQVLLQRYRA